MVLFAVDIDQTVSTGYAGKNLRESIAYYEALGILVPAHITKYPELFQLPDVLRVHETLPGAVDGVNALAKHGRIAYYTVRKHRDPCIEQEIQDITRTWLAKRNFPSADSVIFCRSAMHKLLWLSEAGEDLLVLIDDRWRKIGNAFTELVQSKDHGCIANDLRQRLTLVAFGALSIPESPSGLRTVAFPDWGNVADLFVSIA